MLLSYLMPVLHFDRGSNCILTTFWPHAFINHDRFVCSIFTNGQVWTSEGPSVIGRLSDIHFAESRTIYTVTRREQRILINHKMGLAAGRAGRATTVLKNLFPAILQPCWANRKHGSLFTHCSSAHWSLHTVLYNCSQKTGGLKQERIYEASRKVCWT